MSRQYYAIQQPKKSIFFWRNCKNHKWHDFTATMQLCAKCSASKKNIGVTVVRDIDGVETGELLERELWDTIAVANRYQGHGWIIQASSGSGNGEQGNGDMVDAKQSLRSCRESL